MDEKTTTIGPITLYSGPLPTDAPAASGRAKVILVIPAMEIGASLDCTDPHAIGANFAFDPTTKRIVSKPIFPEDDAPQGDAV